jgi:hypothetical protein
MMPMSSREWYNELPEFITEAQYRALSEEISRTVEVVFHLDAAAEAYRLHAVDWSVPDLEQPVRLTLPIAGLVAA